MDDPGVVARLMLRQFQLFLHQTDLEVGMSVDQLLGSGQAHNPPAHNTDIVALIVVVIVVVVPDRG